jgi:hypothetical protein
MARDHELLLSGRQTLTHLVSPFIKFSEFFFHPVDIFPDKFVGGHRTSVLCKTYYGDAECADKNYRRQYIRQRPVSERIAGEV